MENKNLQPELKDLLENITRYNITHKDGCFIFRFVGYKKDPTHKCIDCGDNCDEYDENRSLIGAYGDLETLRVILNEMRDIIEDYSVNEQSDFINI